MDGMSIDDIIFGYHKGYLKRRSAYLWGFRFLLLGFLVVLVVIFGVE